jgi:hypothetical protein
VEFFFSGHCGNDFSKPSTRVGDPDDELLVHDPVEMEVIFFFSLLFLQTSANENAGERKSSSAWAILLSTVVVI